MSVYRRGSRWAVRIDLDPTAFGGRRRKSVGTYRTRKEAEAAERKALEARDRGDAIAPAKITVAELMTQYIEFCRAHTEKHTAATIETYEQKSRLYIEPALGGISLRKLVPTHVADWVTALRTSGGTNQKPLSPKTVRNVYFLLNAALAWGLDLGKVTRNVCDVEAIKPGQPRPSRGKALADEEVARLLATAEGTRWGPFVTLALATGARRGELCALSWGDVDPNARTLTIARSLSQTKGRVELKGTKTGSIRHLGLSSLALEALRKQRAMQAQDKLCAQGGYVDESAVFATPLGAQITPMSATKAFVRLAKTAKISTTRLHDTRHTAATHLINDGTDVRTAAGILGHSTSTVTLSIYAHLIADTQRAATDNLGARLERISAAAGAAAFGEGSDGHKMATYAPKIHTKTPVKPSVLWWRQGDSNS